MLKLRVDTFVSFLKREGGNYLNLEYSGFIFINDNGKKEKMEKMNR